MSVKHAPLGSTEFCQGIFDWELPPTRSAHPTLEFLNHGQDEFRIS